MTPTAPDGSDGSPPVPDIQLHFSSPTPIRGGNIPVRPLGPDTSPSVVPLLSPNTYLLPRQPNFGAAAAQTTQTAQATQTTPPGRTTQATQATPPGQTTTTATQANDQTTPPNQQGDTALTRPPGANQTPVTPTPPPRVPPSRLPTLVRPVPVPPHTPEIVMSEPDDDGFTDRDAEGSPDTSLAHPFGWADSPTRPRLHTRITGTGPHTYTPTPPPRYTPTLPPRYTPHAHLGVASPEVDMSEPDEGDDAEGETAIPDGPTNEGSRDVVAATNPDVPGTSTGLYLVSKNKTPSPPANTAYKTPSPPANTAYKTPSPPAATNDPAFTTPSPPAPLTEPLRHNVIGKDIFPRDLANEAMYQIVRARVPSHTVTRAPGPNRTHTHAGGRRNIIARGEGHGSIPILPPATATAGPSAAFAVPPIPPFTGQRRAIDSHAGPSTTFAGTRSAPTTPAGPGPFTGSLDALSTHPHRPRRGPNGELLSALKGGSTMPPPPPPPEDGQFPNTPSPPDKKE